MAGLGWYHFRYSDSERETPQMISAKADDKSNNRMSLHDRLANYLQSKGLAESDVPKVFGCFLAAKYATWTAFVVLGIRYQPLTRLFRHARTRGRERFQREVARVDELNLDTKYARRVRAADRTARLARDRIQSARFAREQWKEAPPGWFLWFGDKYNTASQHMANKFASNPYWLRFARSVGQNPKQLALGTAEGCILNKVLFPITAPLELLIISKWFQQKNAKASAEQDLRFGDCYTLATAVEEVDGAVSSDA